MILFTDDFVYLSYNIYILQIWLYFWYFYYTLWRSYGFFCWGLFSFLRNSFTWWLFIFRLFFLLVMLIFIETRPRFSNFLPFIFFILIFPLLFALICKIIIFSNSFNICHSAKYTIFLTLNLTDSPFEQINTAIRNFNCVSRLN